MALDNPERTTVNGPLRAADPRLTEVLLLMSLTLSGVVVCGIARAPWAFWLTSLTPALIAATGWPRSNDDDEVMRFARLSVVTLAALVLGTGPTPTVMLVLIWTLAVAPLYPLLLPYRATVLTISVATIVLSAPVTLRMLTDGYLPPVDLELLAVLIAAVPVVATVSYTVAKAAAPSRRRATGPPGSSDSGIVDPVGPAPNIVPLLLSDPPRSPASAAGPLPVDDIWLTELRVGNVPTAPAPDPESDPEFEPGTPDPEPEERAAAAPSVSTRTDQEKESAGADPAVPTRHRDPNSPWALSVADLDIPSGPASADVPVRSEVNDPQAVPPPEALVTTGELFERITAATSRSEMAGGSAALFLVELEHRTSAPLPGRKETVIQVARRLRAGLPAQDEVLRVEENTVALLIGGIDTEGCRTMARRLSALVEEPVRTARGPLVARCAIGIAVVNKQVRTPQELVEAASLALDQARRHGARRWVLHDPALRANTVTHAELESGLRRSIVERGIGILLQPVSGLQRDPEVLRVEALPRWKAPDGSPIPPDQFLPLADEMGLGTALGQLVLDQALDVWTAFRAAGRPLPGLSVNVSQAQLEDPDFPSHLAARLHTHQMRPDSFTLELPAAAFRDTEQARTCLAMMRSVGVRISLDGFGRSGVSVSGLSELPIDEVKLDRSLVHGIGTDGRLLRSVIALAHSLDLSVVVVGVDKPEQLAAAERLGADAVQGALLSPPRSAEDLSSGIAAARRQVRSHLQRPLANLRPTSETPLGPRSDARTGQSREISGTTPTMEACSG